MYAQGSDRGAVATDTSDAVWHPFGHVVPVGEEWIYVRHQFVNAGYNTAEHQDNMHSDVFGVFTGLPNLAGCIYAEMVLVCEFIPNDSEYLYIGTSSNDRLSVDEYNLFQTVCREQKLQQMLHGHEISARALEQSRIRVSGISKVDIGNFFKKYIVPFLKFGAKRALSAYAPEVIPFINKFDKRIINGKKEEGAVKRKTLGIKSQLEALSRTLSRMSINAKGKALSNKKALNGKKNLTQNKKKNSAGLGYVLKS